MVKGLVASARVTIAAPVAEVWDALVNPATIKRYMFSTDVISEWKEGSTIVWRGVWKGRVYEDRGTILELAPLQTLGYSHFSPLSGLPDVQENYHSVRIELSSNDRGTVVSLSQDNNPTEEARDYSQKNWETMLAGLKTLLEACK
jgi:uncharacterized protein YndB with AHSA1/START domain